MRINTGDDELIEVQMAPLIDCVFLLLIFFLVATTLKKIEKELPIELPESAAAVRAGGAGPFVIGLDQAGNVYIGAQPVTTDMLHTRLREQAEEHPEQKVRLDIDRLTRGQDIIRVLDLCQFEGLKNISFHIADDEKRNKR